MAIIKKRVIILFCIPFVILMLLAVSLLVLYQQRSTRHLDLPELPTKRVIVAKIFAAVPAWKDVGLQDIYFAHPEPRSGVLAVYSVYDMKQLVGKLAVVRHDIACTTCKDLLLGILFDPVTHRVLRIFPLESWELETGVYDPTSFLDQFRGKSLEIPDLDDAEIDGISGATYSVQATLSQLREMQNWLRKESKQLSD